MISGYKEDSEKANREHSLTGSKRQYYSKRVNPSKLPPCFSAKYSPFLQKIRGILDSFLNGLGREYEE